MAVNAARVLSYLYELRSLTGGAEGAQRVAWTPDWLRARSWFQTKLDSLPVASHQDPAGNVWVALEGTSSRTLVMGSHLDSVPNGGWLDGALGVLAALEVLRDLSEHYEGRPPVSIRLVDWADEEGARFGRSLFGSSAFAGTATIAEDRLRTDGQGTTLEDAMKECGLSIEHAPRSVEEQSNVAAYLELHIEQGPVLESAGLPLGVVLGTKGVERHAVTFRGQEAHSGSTPMRARRDAFAAAARFVLHVREMALKYSDAVCTVGSVKTYPGIVTAVVSRCEITLDQRDLDAAVLASMLRESIEESYRCANAEGCTVDWSRIWSIEPIPFHPELTSLCAASIGELGESPLHLPSGPLHDAAEVARVGIPTAMMFVQSLGGISHNKVEDTKPEHIELAVRAFAKLAGKVIHWINGD